MILNTVKKLKESQIKKNYVEMHSMSIKWSWNNISHSAFNLKFLVLLALYMSKDFARCLLNT